MPDSAPSLPSHSSKQLTVRILFGMIAGIFLGVLLNLLSPPVETLTEINDVILRAEETGPIHIDLSSLELRDAEGATIAKNEDGALIVPATEIRIQQSIDQTPPQRHAWVHQWFSNGILEILGNGFVRLLQVIVIPLVVVSLVCGTAALEDITKVGRIGAKTLGLYLFTTALAITFAMIAALVVKPGANFEMDVDPNYTANAAPSLVDVFIGLFPRNIFESMAQGEMLPVIVFAVLLGIALTTAGDAGKRFLAFFQDANEVIMRLVWIIMQLAPLGVFALITRTFAVQGFGAFVPLIKYFFLVLLVLLLHGLITYPALLMLLGRMHPGRFLKKLREVQLFAFSTASSNATLPISMRVCEKKLGVNKSVAAFSIPLGATINMDGTAIMQGVATVFIAQVYGINLDLGQLLMVVLTATLASIGTAGVPGVGLVMLAMVLQQVGLPVAGIGLILGIDRLLDMVRTAVNVTGDCAVSCIVARSEGEWNENVFTKAEEVP